jgi:hypothetical protein
VNRGDQNVLNDLVAALTAHGTTQEKSIRKHLRDIVDIGYHVYIKEIVKNAWREFNKGLPADGSIIGIQFDWKENVVRGRGPVEDSTVIHNTASTAVFGVIVSFFHPELQKTGHIHIPMFSDCLDKTGEAAIALSSSLCFLNYFDWIGSCHFGSVLLLCGCGQMLANIFATKCFCIMHCLILFASVKRRSYCSFLSLGLA